MARASRLRLVVSVCSLLSCWLLGGLLLSCALSVWAPSLAQAQTASAPAELHKVAKGDTLLGIARRYSVTVKVLCQANGIRENQTLRVGQDLRIPLESKKTKRTVVHTVEAGDTLIGIAQRYALTARELAEANGFDATRSIRIGQELVVPGAARTQQGLASDAGMQELEIGMGLRAYYYEPSGPGRLGLKPVLMYLHGRGGNPEADCKRWAKLARNLGWLVCPMGPEDRGDSQRGWSNNWALGRKVVTSALEALRKKHGRRVQLFGNTLIGFSEGAFVAMNVGLREARSFNRWLILGADGSYWGDAGLRQLGQYKERVRRVYLITGAQDLVHEEITEVKGWLRNAGVAVKSATPKDLGHTLALEDRPEVYRDALLWLDRGQV